MRRRGSGSEIAVGFRDEGLVVRGDRPVLDRFVDGLTTTLAKIDPGTGLDAVEAVRSIAGTAKSGRSSDGAALFEFSPRALELLKQYGALPTDDGFFRSMVRDETSFVGNLDWKPVVPGPELVQLQTVAVTLALQATIKDLADAVARVEEKVDDIRDLIRTDQVGQIVAHHRVLTPIADSVMAGGHLTATDWGSVDDLRPQIVGTIERTRLYMMNRVSSAEVKWTAQSRSKQTERLIESELSNMLSLLATAEFNLASWHRLRVERIRVAEPEHLTTTIADVDRELAQQRQLDQELVEAIAGFLAQTVDSTGYEGLEPIARRRLERHVNSMTESLLAFVDERSLDAVELADVALPTFSDSFGLVVDTTVSNVKRVGSFVRRKPERSGPESIGVSSPEPLAEAESVPEGPT